jgi:hypothetical protein
VDKHIKNLWLMIAIASRYGHQPMSEIRSQSVDELKLFNDALGELIMMENQSGQSHMNRFAEGGG